MLVPSSQGWDTSAVGDGAVLVDPFSGDRLYMWYDGYTYPAGSTNRVTIGRARSPITAISDAAGLPGLFMLDQNYPNPFNPSTTISFTVPAFGHVHLAVFDLLGREVAVLVDEKKAPGRYHVTFDATGLASGVYVYRMAAGTFMHTQKMVVVR